VIPWSIVKIAKGDSGQIRSIIPLASRNQVKW